ncbi:hypothetical protein HKD37_18G051300 [Glycine soja]
MNNNPWELLDIDDSDLPSFVCPSNLSSFSSTTLTPSPTGVVQAIMMNQKSRKPLPTQEFKMCAHQGPLIILFDRVPLTVIIVKSCTPNGFDDMRVTLKDPTGTINATMKWTIIEGQDFSSYMMDIYIGSVLVLQDSLFFIELNGILYMRLCFIPFLLTPNII